MEILPVPYQEFKSFFLIFIRVSVILFMFPFFNARIIPVLSKIGLTLIITVILFPVIDNKMVVSPDTLWGMAQLIIAEVMIGMILGLLVRMFFEGIKIMGQLVGFQTGFAIVNILDPQSGSQVSILSNMAYQDRGAGYCSPSLCLGGLWADYKANTTDERYDCPIPYQDSNRLVLLWYILAWARKIYGEIHRRPGCLVN
jgi:hypothetical protein